MFPWMLVKRGRQWSIYDRDSRCYVQFGTKTAMRARLAELQARYHSTSRF